MFRFRRWVLCAAVMLGLSLGATPNLTTISDTLFTADGERFNGVVTISWPSFEAADTSNVASGARKLNITNGILYVQLVPTTNAVSPALYAVLYSSESGNQYNETWTVAPSILPLRIGDVRVPPGSVTGSAPPSITAIHVSDVIGLQNALNMRPTEGAAFAVARAAVINSTGSIDGAVGNLSDCLHVDGTSGTCGSAASTGSFIDSEAPAGALDGVNNTFTLTNAPNPIASLALFRNGLLQRQGVDYTLSAQALAFVSGAIPQSGDILVASYRMSVSLPGVGFVDAEIPSGSVDGTNASFTLSRTPNPTASVALYRNGLRLASVIDYTISGSSITFAANRVPQTGDTLLCFYRVAQ